MEQYWQEGSGGWAFCKRTKGKELRKRVWDIAWATPQVNADRLVKEPIIASSSDSYRKDIITLV